MEDPTSTDLQAYGASSVARPFTDETVVCQRCKTHVQLYVGKPDAGRGTRPVIATAPRATAVHQRKNSRVIPY